MAGCLALDGVASHRAAAHLHEIEGFGQRALDVTVAHGRSRDVVGVRVHQSTQTDRINSIVLAGIPCTGLAKTVIDLAGVISRQRLIQVVESLIRDRRLAWGDRYSVLAIHARQGRNGAGRLREILDARDAAAEIPRIAWSRMVAHLLEWHGLPTPVFEYRIHDRAGAFIGEVDLAYPGVGVVIELDSVRWHLNRRHSKATDVGPID
jgi:hypothetical protein